MRLVLLGANLSILVLLGVYLLDLFSVRAAGLNSLAMVFFAAIISLVIVDEYIKKYNLKNFLAYLIPGLAAIVIALVHSPTLVPIAFILGVVLTVPGIVVLIQKNLKSAPKTYSSTPVEPKTQTESKPELK